MLDAEQRRERERQTWQYRAIEHMHGNQTRFGAVLIAVLQLAAQHNPPRFSHSAYITPAGMVVANAYQARDGSMHHHTPVCHVDEFVDVFRRLADTLKFTDTERDEMFVELRRWIARDFRVSKTEVLPVIH